MTEAVAASLGPAKEALLALERSNARPCRLFGEVAQRGALYEIIQFLGQARWRGELVVETAVGRRSVFFDEGNIVAAESTVPSDYLGEVLRRGGVLTAAQVEECIEARKDGPLRFGEVAVVLGFVTEQALFAEMAQQVVQIFAAVARTSDGSFAFFESFDETQLSYRKRHAVNALLLEVARETDEADFFATRIPSTDHVPVRTADTAAPGDAALYEAIDGTKSIAEICGLTSKSELEVTRNIFALVQTGHVAVTSPTVAVAKVVDVYNRAIIALLRELDAMGEGDGIREKLAKFAADDGYAVFQGAGPSDDGTFDAGVVQENLSAAGGGAPALAVLTSRLYDFVSYALFLARPHLSRRDAPLAPADAARVSQKIARMILPIAPRGEGTLAPPNDRQTARLPRFELPGVDPMRTARIPAVTAAALQRAATRRLRKASEPTLEAKQRAAQTSLVPRVTIPVPGRRRAPAPLLYGAVVLVLLALVATWVLVLAGRKDGTVAPASAGSSVRP